MIFIRDAEGLDHDYTKYMTYMKITRYMKYSSKNLAKAGIRNSYIVTLYHFVIMLNKLDEEFNAERFNLQHEQGEKA